MLKDKEGMSLDKCTSYDVKWHRVAVRLTPHTTCVALHFNLSVKRRVQHTGTVGCGPPRRSSISTVGSAHMMMMTGTNQDPTRAMPH